MLRRYALEYERSVDLEVENHFPFRPDGQAVLPESEEIFRQFLMNPEVAIPALIISRRTLVHPLRVRDICRMLVAVDLLEESPPQSDVFRLSSDPRSSMWIERIRKHLSSVPGRQSDAA